MNHIKIDLIILVKILNPKNSLNARWSTFTRMEKSNINMSKRWIPNIARPYVLENPIKKLNFDILCAFRWKFISGQGEKIGFSTR